MSDRAKIHLSKLENELINNTEWILTKQAIINKVYLLLGELHETYATIWQEEKKFISVFNGGGSGKISKGENYLGLPYAILDYPAVFKKENIFAIRTMFWWGNFFSITLHISGREIIERVNIRKMLENLKELEFLFCVNTNEWEHDFNKANYLPVTDISDSLLAEISSNSFLKISKKIDLKKWNDVLVFLEKAYREIMEIIKANFPVGEKVL